MVVHGYPWLTIKNHAVHGQSWFPFRLGLKLSTLVLIAMQLFHPVLFFQALLLLFDLSTERACLSDGVDL